PFGEVRYGDAPTDRRFTGQREEAGIGLYDYGARFYSAALGRFISADTIVPGIDSQALNRYTYVLNNPLRYRDPSGHDPMAGAVYIYEPDGRMRERVSSIGLVQFAGDWSTSYRNAINKGAWAIAKRLLVVAQADKAKAELRAKLTGEDPAAFTSALTPIWGLSEKDTFRAIYGTVTFRYLPGNTVLCPGAACWAETHLDWAGNGCAVGQICYDDDMFRSAPGFNVTQNAVHELGHGLDHRGGRQARANLGTDWRTNPLLIRDAGGFATADEGEGSWQQSNVDTSGEVFADMFLGWVFGRWGEGASGAARPQYMQGKMPGVIALTITGN
ncbi:MAG: RHS repeat-associated core domain-containing protein, partial [Anaerolineae bacterium]|nr:RHS repeat-associated core domain-containing protein [Anaerolineae bacterium]